MSGRSTVFLNSLITLVLAAIIYEFVQGEHLTRQVASIDRNLLQNQQQMSQLKEAASAMLEQNVRRFDQLSQQLTELTQKPRPVRDNSASRVELKKVSIEVRPKVQHSRTERTAPSAIEASQPACGIQCFARILFPLVRLVLEATGYKVVKEPSAAALVSNPNVDANASVQPASVSEELRRQQLAKLQHDRQEFAQMLTQACEIGTTGDDLKGTAKVCEQRMRQMADQGNSAAQQWLAAEAKDKQHDTQAAMAWLERAANQGDPEAMNKLGAIYASGSWQANQAAPEFPADPIKAMYWYNRSADLGDSSAMGTLGDIFLEGRLGPPDYAQAIHWYEKAAETIATFATTGRRAAANFAGVLGDIYYNGAGVERNKMEAYKWYIIGCEDAARVNGLTNSAVLCASRDKIANELGSIDAAKVQTIAAEWEKLHR